MTEYNSKKAMLVRVALIRSRPEYRNPQQWFLFEAPSHEGAHCEIWRDNPDRTHTSSFSLLWSAADAHRKHAEEQEFPFVCFELNQAVIATVVEQMRWVEDDPSWRDAHKNYEALKRMTACPARRFYVLAVTDQKATARFLVTQLMNNLSSFLIKIDEAAAGADDSGWPLGSDLPVDDTGHSFTSHTAPVGWRPSDS